jgi:hypothetical protein
VEFKSVSLFKFGEFFLWLVLIDTVIRIVHVIQANAAVVDGNMKGIK